MATIEDFARRLAKERDAKLTKHSTEQRVNLHCRRILDENLRRLWSDFVDTFIQGIEAIRQKSTVMGDWSNNVHQAVPASLRAQISFRSDPEVINVFKKSVGMKRSA
jgi:hypothetical protein